MTEEMNQASFGRILVVDDTTANLQLLTNLLSEQGYMVHPASDGELALQFVQLVFPDLILLDIRMPGMDGYEVCRRLKADERTRAIPVIFISILEDERDKLKGFQAGGVDYITKPFQPEEVLARVKIQLSLRELTERLEQKVSERTEELTLVNQRLQQELAERRKADEALRESEAKYRLIVDTATEGVWMLGPNFSTVFVNARMAEMLGYARDEMLGRPVTDFMHTEDTADHGLRMERRRRGIAENYERRFLRKDGQPLWTLASATPIFDGEQHFNGSLAMFTDITERKQAEDVLRRYKDELETIVEQRTVELKLSRDAAEAANKAKSLFLANMSHELRTPLNAILGFSRLMGLETGLTSKQLENLDIINRSGEHLLALINDVLEIAKIESGKLQLEIAPFDLGNLVREVCELMQLRAQQKGLSLVLDQASEFPRHIKGDEARLRQILLNLIGNAVKFTEQGSVTIRLGVKNNAGHKLILEIKDTGPGIAAEDRARLFEPFVQLTAGGSQSGTGLGLTITRQFVQMMGGRIELESTFVEGALFRVELPVELADAADVSEQATNQHLEIAGLASGQPVYRILIAEDQVESQLLLKRLMEQVGLEVKIADNGEQCVSLFQQWQPHLIWMDWRMPVMNGEEATRRIRGLPGGDHVKIVAVTASVFIEQRQEMVEAGIDDFVRKPYHFDEIYQCMARVLGLKYRYHSETLAEKASATTLTAEMLAVLPATKRKTLRDALLSLDTELIAQAMGEVREADQTLGLALSGLVDNFDYPVILKLLDELGE